MKSRQPLECGDHATATCRCDLLGLRSFPEPMVLERGAAFRVGARSMSPPRAWQRHLRFSRRR